jgi:hypothetical protein
MPVNDNGEQFFSPTVKIDSGICPPPKIKSQLASSENILYNGDKNPQIRELAKTAGQNCRNRVFMICQQEPTKRDAHFPIVPKLRIVFDDRESLRISPLG